MNYKKIKKYFDNFFNGTSCHGKVLCWFNHRFILLKHLKHTAYINRVDGTKACETYYFLVDTKLVEPDSDSMKLGDLSRGEVGVWIFSGQLTNASVDRMNFIITDAGTRKFKPLTRQQIFRMKLNLKKPKDQKTLQKMLLKGKK